MAFQWDTVAIIGVGAIGASLGLGIRKRHLAKTVLGVTRSAASAEAAVAMGAVDEISESMEAAAARSALTIVCTPVMEIAEHVRRCSKAAAADAVFTDAGSTKGSLCRDLEHLERGVFVGSHPLAGTHVSGPGGGDADLFVGRAVIITPREGTPPNAVEQVEDFWRQLGANVSMLSPDRHDQLLAASSHLPHAIASLVAASTPDEALEFVAKGWKDATRIAAGSPELWQQIFRDNRTNTLDCLRRFETSLKRLIEALDNDNPTVLMELLERGKQKRDAVGN